MEVRKKFFEVTSVLLFIVATGLLLGSCGIWNFISTDTSDTTSDHESVVTTDSVETTDTAGIGQATDVPDVPDIVVPTLWVDSVTAQNGEAVVFVRMIKNPGIIGGMITLSFPENLILETIKAGELLENTIFTKPGTLKSGYNVVWCYSDPSLADFSDGILFQMKFRVAEGTPIGRYRIALLAGEDAFIGADLYPVDLAVKQGCVYVEK